MMAEITLYNYELDESCYKVRLMLSMLGVTWTTVAVDAFPGKEETTPPFLAMNPLGRLPILQDGELTLHGTEAILAHLARAHDASGRWLPAGGADFANVMQWLVFSARDLDVTIAARKNALFGASGDEKALRTRSREMLRIMDDHLIRQGVSGVRMVRYDPPDNRRYRTLPGFRAQPRFRHRPRRISGTAPLGAPLPRPGRFHDDARHTGLPLKGHGKGGA